MSAELREPDFRAFLQRMAAEMPTLEETPPRAVRRASRRLTRNAILAVLAAVLVAAGSLSGVRGLLRAEPRPAGPDPLVTLAVPGEPAHVAVGEGSVWVAGNGISKIDPTTNAITVSWPGRTTADGDASPAPVDEGIPVDEVIPDYVSVSRSDGSAIAVGEGYVWVSGGEFDGEIVRIDPRTDRLLVIHVGGGYSDPFAVAVGAGSVWATSSTGHLQRIEPQTTRDEVAATVPVGVALGVAVLDDTVWVAVDGLVGVDAASLEIVADRHMAIGDDLAAGFGSLWAGAAGQPGPTILRIDPPDGSIRAAVELGLGTIQSVAVGEGAIWIGLSVPAPADSARGRVVRIDPQTTAITGGMTLPTPALGLAAGEGAVWVVDGRGSLYRIDPQAFDVSSAAGG
jgi:streptogramin lyase